MPRHVNHYPNVPRAIHKLLIKECVWVRDFFHSYEPGAD